MVEENKEIKQIVKVYLLIHKNDKPEFFLLYIKDTDDKYKTPEGFVNDYESPRDVAKRILKEQTGIDLSDNELPNLIGEFKLKLKNVSVFFAYKEIKNYDKDIKNNWNLYSIEAFKELVDKNNNSNNLLRNKRDDGALTELDVDALKKLGYPIYDFAKYFIKNINAKSKSIQ